MGASGGWGERKKKQVSVLRHWPASFRQKRGCFVGLVSASGLPCGKRGFPRQRPHRPGGEPSSGGNSWGHIPSGLAGSRPKQPFLSRRVAQGSERRRSYRRGAGRRARKKRVWRAGRRARRGVRRSIQWAPRGGGARSDSCPAGRIIGRPRAGGEAGACQTASDRQGVGRRRDGGRRRGCSCARWRR